MILEGILSSLSREGEANFAPIGVILEAVSGVRLGCEVKLRLYPGSQTYQNVLATQEAVMNFTDDVGLFVETALDSAQPAIVPSDRVRPPRLRDALTVWELEVSTIEASVVPATVTAKVAAVAEKPGYRGFCRGQMAVMEAAIAATRLAWIPASSWSENWDTWFELVHKTGGPREHQALHRLADYLRQHGIEVE